MSVEPPARIVLRAELTELDRLHAWIEKLCATQRFSPRLSFQLDLCLGELVTNVISYGYSDLPAPPEAVVVKFATTPTQVVLEIVDRGAAFDPLAQDTPEPARTLDEARIGGLGIPLVRRTAAGIDYRREQGCNRLRMSFPISRTAQ
jgi:sigma-B regulation protein RsbU (phosphoserine phosphatase)